MKQLKTLNKTNIENKTVLYRAPYDIGLIEKDGQLVVEDDSRISATLPTLNYLLQKNCKIVILTWVKRPNGIDSKLSTAPHAKRLSELLNYAVSHITDCIGEKVTETIKSLAPKQILMLENVRFYQQEFDDQDEFAKKLTVGLDIIVFDAFPQAHRKHASTTGILRHLPSVSGLYFEKEYNSLAHILDNPQRPFTAIIGGAKVSDKIEAVKNLLNIADIILIGGGLANAFLKGQGKEMGASYIEDNYVDTAKGEKKDWVLYSREILDISESDTKSNEDLKTKYKISADMPVEKIMLPYDLVTGKNPNEAPSAVQNGLLVGTSTGLDGSTTASNQPQSQDLKTELTVSYHFNNVVKPNLGAYDIGPITSKTYCEIISQSKTIFWAGPMGVFENEEYSNGTNQIVKCINQCTQNAVTIVAGGDTIAAVNKFGSTDKVTHISLAGGATLDFLAGVQFPVMEYLSEE